MQFMLKYQVPKITPQLKETLEGVKSLLKGTQNLFSGGDQRKIAGALLRVIPFSFYDDIVENYRRYGGEQAESLAADYFWMVALLCGAAGQQDRGLSYIARAKQIRTAGVFHEWCQTYYKSL